MNVCIIYVFLSFLELAKKYIIITEIAFDENKHYETDILIII